MKEYFDSSSDQKDNIELIRRFENMLARGELYFFETDEFIEIAEHYLVQNKIPKAQEVLEIAQSQHPMSFELKILEAEILAVNNRTAEALRILDTVELIESSNTDVYLTRSNIYRQMGNFEASYSQLQNTLHLADGDEVDEYYQVMAFDLVALDRHKEAIIFYKRLLKRSKKNEEFLIDLDQTYAFLDENEDWIDYLKAYVDENPYSNIAWFCLGNAFTRIELLEKAYEAYEFSYLIDDGELAMENMGHTLIQLGKYGKAIELYKGEKSDDQLSIIEHFYIAECYEKLNDFIAAESQYRKALEKDNQMSATWLGVGLALDHQGKVKEALPYIQKAISLDDQNAEFWYVLAEVYDKLDEIVLASEAFETVLSLSYNEVDVFLDYSSFLFKNDLIDEANEIVERGFIKHPNSAEIYYRFVAYLIMNNQLADAIEFLEKALELDSSKLNQLIEFCPDSLNSHEVLATIEKFK